MTTEPVSPGGSGRPWALTTRISVPVAAPTEPGLRRPGGSGLLATWWLASVIPYASITGTPNAASTRSRRTGGSGEDAERMKRR
jgi:hypothetical protein